MEKKQREDILLSTYRNVKDLLYKNPKTIVELIKESGVDYYSVKIALREINPKRTEKGRYYLENGI